MTSDQEVSTLCLLSRPSANPVASGVTTALYTISRMSAASAGPTGTYLSSGLASAIALSPVPSLSPFTGAASGGAVFCVGLLVACLLGSLMIEFPIEVTEARTADFRLCGIISFNED